MYVYILLHYVLPRFDLPLLGISPCTLLNSFKTSQLTVLIFKSCCFYTPVFLNVKFNICNYLLSFELFNVFFKLFSVLCELLFTRVVLCVLKVFWVIFCLCPLNCFLLKTTFHAADNYLMPSLLLRQWNRYSISIVSLTSLIVRCFDSSIVFSLRYLFCVSYFQCVESVIMCFLRPLLWLLLSSFLAYILPFIWPMFDLGNLIHSLVCLSLFCHWNFLKSMWMSSLSWILFWFVPVLACFCLVGCLFYVWQYYFILFFVLLCIFGLLNM